MRKSIVPEHPLERARRKAKRGQQFGFWFAILTTLLILFNGLFIH